jgi:hypothetical protein
MLARSHRSVATGLSVLLALSLVACEEDDAAQEDAKPMVGILELPISLRHEGKAPSNPAAIEIAPAALRLDGATVVELDGGKLPESGKSETISELLVKLRAGATRGGATIRAHVNTPWATTSRVLGTLEAADLDAVGFLVRKGPGAETGFLSLSAWRVGRKGDDVVKFESEAQRSWDDFAEHWEAVYSACRAGSYVDCDFKPQNIAEGGDLEIRLFARGSAVKLDLTRFGGPDPEEEKAPAAGGGGGGLIEGIAPAPAPSAGEEEEEAPPATDATFTWRFKETTSDSSVIPKAMQPFCGTQSCGAVVEAEGGTSTMSLLSFLGAAFPNGTPEPHAEFVVPTR